MQRPSDNWKQIRRAALERAERNVIHPLLPIYYLFLGASVIYLAGFVHLSLFDIGPELGLLGACLVLVFTAVCALIPILFGAVLTLHFANTKLRTLTNE